MSKKVLVEIENDSRRIPIIDKTSPYFIVVVSEFIIGLKKKLFLLSSISWVTVKKYMLLLNM